MRVLKAIVLVPLFAALLCGVGAEHAFAASKGTKAEKAEKADKAAPEDFIAAYRAFLEGDYATAMKLWQRLAERGDVDAAFNLATLYDNGFGVPVDTEKASAWYRRAADRKVAAAEVALSRIARAAPPPVQPGVSTDPNANPAVKALRKAAENGGAEAQFALAVAYDRGLGVIQNYSTAAAWYRRAADQGLVAAQYNLATLYDEGLGVQNDMQQAIAWYRKAAEAGSAMAANNLGYHHEFGIGVPQNDALALAWYRKAAEAGLDTAANNLAVLLQLGRGAPRDYAEAAHWYRVAAAQGHGEAMVNLAVLLSNGFGVERDRTEALAWLLRARGTSEPAAAARASELGAILMNELGSQESARASSRAAALTLKPTLITLGTRGDGQPQPRAVGGFVEPWLSAQRYLSLLGYYDGPVDGSAGTGSRAALLSFVKQFNPKAKSVELTPEMLARLAWAWESATTAPPAP